MKAVVCFLLLAVMPAVDAAFLRQKDVPGQDMPLDYEPDTACGKGFASLDKGSRDYFTSAVDALWTHPGHISDKVTFTDELSCWFGNMATSHCGDLPSQADTRKKDLTEKCLNHEDDWLDIWKMYSADEVAFFKKNYPAVEEDAPLIQEQGSDLFYKQAFQTVKEMDKKELLCLTLFTIDDECVKWSYIRLGK